MIKVKYSDYSCFGGGHDDSYEKTIEGDLPEGVKSVSASYDGGRGHVSIGGDEVLDDLGAGDYDVSHKGVYISVDRGRFYCSGNGFNFQDLSAGNDFNFIFEQM